MLVADAVRLLAEAMLQTTPEGVPRASSEDNDREDRLRLDDFAADRIQHPQQTKLDARMHRAARRYFAATDEELLPVLDDYVNVGPEGIGIKEQLEYPARRLEVLDVLWQVLNMIREGKLPPLA